MGKVIRRSFEGVAPGLEHGGGSGLGHGEGHGSEVAEHGVRVPASEESDDGFVDARAEEGGGAARPEQVRLNFVRWDPRFVLDCGCCFAETRGDMCGGDVGGTGAVEGRVERARWVVSVCAEEVAGVLPVRGSTCRVR